MAQSSASRTPATIVLVPGLRDHVPQHWQTLLAQQLPDAVSVLPMGRDNLCCTSRVDALEAAIVQVAGPVILVAHSGGCITVAHWALRSPRAVDVRGALLAVPPDFDKAMPREYPSLQQIEAA